jgi:hypothetical protein
MLPIPQLFRYDSLMTHNPNPCPRYRLVTDRAMANAIVSDFSTDAVVISLHHWDGDYYARVESMPILGKSAYCSSGENVRDAIANAIQDVAISLSLMAEELRAED